MKSVVHRSLSVACALAIVLGTLPAPAQSFKQSAEFVFVANQSSNNLSSYQMESNGALLQVSGSPFSAGSSPNSVTVVPSGVFAYVADVFPGGVTGFKVVQNGTVSPLFGSPFAAPTGTVFVTTDPGGRFL